ncbi:MAG: hypothetical protein ACTTJ6_03575 [Treponema sp.]
MIKENKEYIDLLPTWATEFSKKYCSKTANLYCIHGNVRDFLPHRAYHGVFSFVKNRFKEAVKALSSQMYEAMPMGYLITSRQDLLPVDLKRQGRAEEHLALFYPETLEEKTDIFETMQKKLHIKTTGVVFKDIVKRISFEASGADIEAILVRAKMNALISHRAMVTKEDLLKTIEDFIPPSYPYEIELQNLVASIECTSKEMVPKKYREMSRQKLLADIMEIKQILGEK